MEPSNRTSEGKGLCALKEAGVRSRGCECRGSASIKREGPNTVVVANNTVQSLSVGGYF
jgi:hypothetical protein